MANLTSEELDTLQGSLKEFNKCKMQLGETVLQQQALMSKMAGLREESAEQERKLIDKYGKDSVINIETGEVKPSKKE
jgi:hypothetical protein|tara:strand:+ start:72 stop:305 length:234 start_codon:yes stop_codon:yes gene_type:complete